MRIAHFTDTYRPVINGVVTSIGSLKEALEKRGHEVTLFTPSVPGYEDREGGVHRLSSVHIPLQPDARFAFPWPPGAMARYLREKVDVVHVHTPFNVGVMGVWKAKAARRPLVFTHHTLWEEYIHYLRLRPSLGRKVSDQVCGYLLRNANVIVAPSQDVQQRLLEQGWHKEIRVIPTGIDADLFRGGDAKVVQQELNLSADTPLFLFVGRVAKEKSIDFLLRTMVDVGREVPEAVLAIVGGGPELEALKTEAARLQLGQSVRFLGYRDRGALKHYLAACRAFVFASETETQGLVLLEAAAAGRPVVAVRASGVKEAVNEGVTGILLDSGEQAGFANAMLRLARDPAYANELGSHSGPWAEQFSSSAMATQIEELYLKLIQRS